MLWRILCCYAKRMEDGRDVETCNSIFLWYRKSNKLLKENLIMSEDIQFQIECLSAELVEMLMRRYGWDMKNALENCILQKPINDCVILLVACFMKGLYMYSRIRKTR